MEERLTTLELSGRKGGLNVPPSALVGGYANGFVTAESGEGEYRDLSPEEYYTSFVAKWIGEANPDR